jgi:hypothetical protein
MRSIGEKLRYTRTDDPSVIREADASAFQEVCDGGGGFVGVPADAADGEDEVTEGEVLAAAGFEGGFHGWC